MKLKYIIPLLILLIPIAYATEVNHTITELQSPINWTIGYNDTGDNNTHLFPIWCKDDLSTVISTGKCDVTRTLNFGETYVKDDANCDISFGCPSCIAATVANTTHIVRWSIEGNDHNIIVKNLNNNDTRSYSRESNFDIETEFTVTCPDVGDADCDEADPLNITDTQFMNYCVRPFGNYGDNLNRLNDRYAISVEGKDQKIIDLSSSNIILAGDLGGCEEQLNGFEALKIEHETTKDELRTCSKNLITANEDADKKGFWQLSFWILIGINLFIALEMRLKKSERKELEGDR